MAFPLSAPVPSRTCPTLVEPGCWAAVGPRRFVGRPALFLDRDGVVVEEVNYLRRVEDMRLARGAGETLALFNRADVPVILVTNQSGVGRGYLDWAGFGEIQDAIGSSLAEAGAHVDATFACGYHEAGLGVLRMADHGWRKPSPGMLHAAAEALGVDLARSVLVGDRAQDLAAAKAAGLRLGLHVATGHGHTAQEQAAARALGGNGFEVRLLKDICGAQAVLPALTEA